MKKPIEDYKKVSFYDTYVGIVAEDGVAKMSLIDECSMSFTFLAYVKNDTEIVQGDISVHKDIPSIETPTEEIEALTIVKIEGEEINYHSQRRIQMHKLVQTNVQHDGLQQILNKRKEPVIYMSSTIGPFELNKRLGWYEGRTIWNGNVIQFFLTGDLNKIQEAEKNAIAILQEQDIWDELIKRKICEELLPLKNERWLDEGEMPLTESDFISKIVLESIDINEGKEFQMGFNDGDTFWGHLIIVQADLHKNIKYIGIEG